jgi:isopentenyl-diphosphate delta-isomerase
MPEVILVDDADLALGTVPKLSAHQNGGILHRAFSVFIVNRSGEMLIQRRGRSKYHFAGLWTNSCCSHPRPGEELIPAAGKRLREELGFTTDLQELFCFTYRAHDPASGLTEHEFDHVLLGRFDGDPSPDPREVDEWKCPHLYTPWFRIALPRVLQCAASLS